MRWLPRTRIYESNPLLWKWHTEVAPSGFWVKTRGPFMWWGKDGKRTEGKVSYSHDNTSDVQRVH